MMHYGVWWYHSDCDPRWNISGECEVGGFCMPSDAVNALKRLIEKFGQPP